MTQERGKQPASEGMPKKGEFQGEGDYVGGRRFQDPERSFAEKESPTARKAREAADALDGPEAEELEEARRGPRAGKIPPACDAHVDEQLDHGLEETFPASDPVSISPAAD